MVKVRVKVLSFKEMGLEFVRVRARVRVRVRVRVSR